MVSKAQKPGLARPRPWQGERPGAAAVRQASSGELFTLVAFDVPCDKARRRVGEICKDYGLKRAQWSVFEGTMSRNRREELSARVAELLGNAEGGGRAAIFPIGSQEAGWAWRLSTAGVPAKDGSGASRARERVREEEKDIAALLGASIEAEDPSSSSSGGESHG